MTQLTKEMNKFDDMMNYLKRQLREVYSEAPKGCPVHEMRLPTLAASGRGWQIPIGDSGDGHGVRE